ncbi:MAG TPA: hypothetical protein VHP36_10260 [Chitinispirillaceae bacterium]|nr:hypothetical protein [Chitinispirillaceae bacterium]
MQQTGDNKSRLLEFIDRNALDPVLEALPEQYSSSRDRKLLVNLQKRAAKEKDEFHNEQLSLSQIKEKYFREIYWETHLKFGKELEDLELPRFLQLRKQFLQLCTELLVN